MTPVATRVPVAQHGPTAIIQQTPPGDPLVDAWAGPSSANNDQEPDHHLRATCKSRLQLRRQIAATLHQHALNIEQGHPQALDPASCDAWCPHIERAGDIPGPIALLAAAPAMYQALQADQNAIQAGRAHTALMLTARNQGWHGNPDHPGHDAIRHAAQDRWSKELLAADLKRRALQRFNAHEQSTT